MGFYLMLQATPEAWGRDSVNPSKHARADGVVLSGTRVSSLHYSLLRFRQTDFNSQFLMKKL